MSAKEVALSFSSHPRGATVHGVDTIILVRAEDYDRLALVMGQPKPPCHKSCDYDGCQGWRVGEERVERCDDCFPAKGIETDDQAAQIAYAAARNDCLPSSYQKDKDLILRWAAEAEKPLEVPDLSTHEPCGLRDEEVMHVTDTDSLAFATQGDIGRKDLEDKSVWTLCWYRVRNPPVEEPVRDWSVEWRIAEFPAGKWNRHLPGGTKEEALQMARKVIRLRKADSRAFTSLSLRVMHGETTIYTESSMPEEIT